MHKRLIERIKTLYQYCVMRWFSSPETFIKWYLSKKHGIVRLHDGTWAVNQSDEFHSYCYNEGYKAWEKTNT